MQETKTWCVYMHTNKNNQKVYIGITSQTIEQRWKKGFGYKQCPHFWSAIQKYGWDNFEHIIFADNLTKDEANEMEIMLIALYQTNNPKYGYNITSGGDGVNGYSINEESRRKMSESHKGMVVPQEVREKISNTLRGKVVSPETRKKLSEATTRQMTIEAIEYLRNIHTGRKRTDATKRKMREAKLKNAKIVLQLDLNNNIVAEFASLTIASEQTGINKSCIGNCCRGVKNHSTAGGFKWRYKEDWIKLRQEEVIINEKAMEC